MAIAQSYELRLIEHNLPDGWALASRKPPSTASSTSCTAAIEIGEQAFADDTAWQGRGPAQISAAARRRGDLALGAGAGGRRAGE